LAIADDVVITFLHDFGMVASRPVRTRSLSARRPIRKVGLSMEMMR
jgi:hypothetical protein